MCEQAFSLFHIGFSPLQHLILDQQQSITMASLDLLTTSNELSASVVATAVAAPAATTQSVGAPLTAQELQTANHLLEVAQSTADAVFCSELQDCSEIVRARLVKATVRGTTLLYACARYGCIKGVKILLDSGADPSQAATSGSTPLHGAAWGGHTAIVKLLLRHPRTDPAAKNEFHETAVDNAKTKKRTDIVVALEAHGALSEGENEGEGFVSTARNMQVPAVPLQNKKVGTAAVPIERYLRGCTKKTATKCLRVVCISDTHVRWNNLERLQLPDGDVLVHCGDFTNSGKQKEWESMLQFMTEAASRFRHRIFICGNHDYVAKGQTREKIQDMFGDAAVYLQDTAVVIDGVKFYGSPCTNINMAFHASEDQQEVVFSTIPTDTDVLMTHQPPFNCLDLAWVRNTDNRRCHWCSQIHERYQHWGSKALRRRVAVVNPSVHVFGHVHDEKGIAQLPPSNTKPSVATDSATTLFVNAAMDLAPKPIVVHLYSQ